MNQYRTQSMLKTLARGQLSGYFGKLIPALLLHFIAIFVLESMVSSLFSAKALWADIAYYGVMFIISVFSGLFAAAEHFIYLKVCCHYQVSVGDIFWAFVATPDRFLKIQFILSLLNFICMLPYHVTSYLARNNTVYSVLSFAFLAVGMIAYMLIELKYALVYYLAIDFPKHTVSKLYTLSNKIMNGHKVRLFCINLSFFPLFLLCILSLGIGFLWVVPYMYATEANFYLDLMAQRNRSMNNGL